MFYEDSEARRLLVEWYADYAKRTGNTQKDLVAVLGRNINRPNITYWFAPDASQPAPLPLEHAVTLSEHDPAFPFKEYVGALWAFRREAMARGRKLSTSDMDAVMHVLALELSDCDKVIRAAQRVNQLIPGYSLERLREDEIFEALRAALERSAYEEADEAALP